MVGGDGVAGGGGFGDGCSPLVLASADPRYPSHLTLPRQLSVILHACHYKPPPKQLRRFVCFLYWRAKLSMNVEYCSSSRQAEQIDGDS